MGGAEVQRWNLYIACSEVTQELHPAPHPRHLTLTGAGQAAHQQLLQEGGEEEGRRGVVRRGGEVW